MNTPAFTLRQACRVCGSDGMSAVASFGTTPISDKLAPTPHSVDPAPKLPLDLVRCATCGLTQLSLDVDPTYLFADDYPYYSSVSPHLSAHFHDSAAHLIDTLGIGPEATVIEAASNDGCLLRHFAAVGARTIGFDPADGPAKVAATHGIDARIEFFGRDVAWGLADTGVKADLFLANNVLAHVPDLRGFVAGIATILKPSGTAVIEVPYFVNLVEGREFDTIYHQHLCYFLVGTLSRLLRDAGLCLADVWRLPIHGGSLRLFIRHGDTDGTAAQALIDAEREQGQDTLAYARRIGWEARAVRDRLRALIDAELAAGRRVRAYGAAGKATTQLAFCGLDKDRLGAVADLNPHKHGHYMPGTDLVIVSRDALMADAPDTILILAWNFADEIMRQLREEAGFEGRFIVPLPDPVLV
ncbi:MAG: class I SAM-dependent methyltransferase [Pseudomonadota bacterium]|nr:class I SAM-dependent methyltransferase [Pseudomonadota bacterium]